MNSRTETKNIIQSIFIFLQIIKVVHCLTVTYIDNDLTKFDPCGNEILSIEKICNNDDFCNQENFWNGLLKLEKYPNLPNARVQIKFDVPVTVTVDNKDGKVTPRQDYFRINYFKKEDGFKTVKFHVEGEKGGQFPNVEYIYVNDVNVCLQPLKWAPSNLRVGSDMTSTTGIIKTEQKISTSSCGRRQIHHQALVLDGYPSREGDWPWHAALYHLSRNYNWEYKCGGTLISTNTILTAAHCVVDLVSGQTLISSRILVRLGQYNRLVAGRNTQDFGIFRVIAHSNFSATDLKNDIALLKLSTEANLNQYVQPSCLWSSEDSLTGKIGFIIGWGYIGKDKYASVLTEGQMPIVPALDCLDSNRGFFGTYLSDLNYCAGFRNGTSVCNGDSGGGMFFEKSGQYFIRGIVSLSVSNTTESICDPTQYVLFTDVAKYINWIQTNM